QLPLVGPEASVVDQGGAVLHHPGEAFSEGAGLAQGGEVPRDRDRTTALAFDLGDEGFKARPVAGDEDLSVGVIGVLSEGQGERPADAAGGAGEDQVGHGREDAIRRQGKGSPWWRAEWLPPGRGGSHVVRRNSRGRSRRRRSWSTS